MSESLLGKHKLLVEKRWSPEPLFFHLIFISFLPIESTQRASY